MRTEQDPTDDRSPQEHPHRAAHPGRRWVPWQGRATGADRALIAAMLLVVAVGLALRPLKPFLIASHPVLLEFLSGDLIAVGAAAAFARIGEAPLWLVVLAGTLGMIKFDWLAWWAGRRWGAGIIGLLTASPRVLRWAGRARDADPRLIRAAVALAMLPGVPTAVVFALAGWAGLRWTTFLLLDAVGALAVTGLVAGLGYGLGQHAVDAVLLVDRYASAVSLTLLGPALALPLGKRLIRRWVGSGRAGEQEDPRPSQRKSIRRR